MKYVVAINFIIIILFSSTTLSNEKLFPVGKEIKMEVIYGITADYSNSSFTIAEPTPLLDYPLFLIKESLRIREMSFNFQVLFVKGLNNAGATIIDGDRYLIIDTSWAENIYREFNSYWPLVSVLAHEIGHHINGDTLKNKSNRLELELKADRFSASILAQLGAYHKDSRRFFEKYATDEATLTHPAKNMRLNNIKNGFGNGCRLRKLCNGVFDGEDHSYQILSMIEEQTLCEHIRSYIAQFDNRIEADNAIQGLKNKGISCGGRR